MQNVLKSKKKWMIISGSVVLLVIAAFTFKFFIDRPTNLNNELEFIGETRITCFLTICDSGPSAEYYFGTNLNPEDLKVYFKAADYVEYPNNLGGGGGNYNFKDLFFTSKKNNKEFVIQFYDNKQAVIDAFDLKPTDKRFVISMSDDFYPIVRDSLK